MKILFLRPQVELGGVSRHMLSLKDDLDRLGHEVIMGAGGGEWFSIFSPSQVFPLFPSTPLNFIKSIYQIRRFVKENNIDVIHSHHRFSTMVAKGVSTLSGIPSTSTVHEFKTNWKKIASLWIPQRFFCVSEALKTHMESHYGVAGSASQALQLLPDYLNKEPQGEVPEELLDLQDLPKIAFVGRLSPEKGAPVLIDAMPDILKETPELKALFVGEGEQREELESQVQRLGLKSKILFLGARDNVRKILQNVDLLVAPSVEEAYGLVALEAMSVGCPVVASRVGGLVEVVQDGETGVLVPPNDSKLLAENITNLLQNPQQLGFFSKNAKDYIRGHLHDASQGKAPSEAALLVEKLYKELTK